MPHFTLSLSPNGPVVDAVVFVSEGRRQALEKQNQPIPQGIPIRGLIDTGASGTCVDPSVLATLGLSPTGSTLMLTPSTGKSPHPVDVYDIALVIPARNGRGLVHGTLPVSACELLHGQGIHALIGRDVLGGCVLNYNGTEKFFTLAF